MTSDQDKLKITQDAHRILNEFVGQEAVDLGVLTRDQQARTLEIQSRFVAYNSAHDEKHQLKTSQGWDKDPQSAKLLNDAEWQKLGITEEQMKSAHALVDSGKGVGKLAPLSGDIATTLGFIKPGTKDNLLIAQAGERIHRAAEDIGKPAGGKPFTKDDFLKSGDKVNGGPHDSVKLQGAQAASYMVGMLDNAVRLDPDLADPKKNPELAAKIAHSTLAAETLAVDAYDKGAAGFGIFHPHITGKVMAAATDVADKSHLSHHPSISQSMKATDALNDTLTAVKKQLVKDGKVTEHELASLDKHQEESVTKLKEAHHYLHANVEKQATLLMHHEPQAPHTPQAAPPSKGQTL